MVSVGDRQVHHRVAQELQSLVGLAVVLGGVTRMRHGQG
jgi:hypothetical protein